MKYLKQFENFNTDSEVQYSIVDVDSGYRIFAQTPVMRQKGLAPEDCELLFGKGTMWRNYQSWEEAQSAIDSLVDKSIDEREPEEQETFFGESVEPESYEQLSKLLLDEFDDVRACSYYMDKLKKLGKLQDFLESEDGKLFKELRQHLSR